MKTIVKSFRSDSPIPGFEKQTGVLRGPVLQGLAAGLLLALISALAILAFTAERAADTNARAANDNARAANENARGANKIAYETAATAKQLAGLADEQNRMLRNSLRQTARFDRRIEFAREDLNRAKQDAERAKRDAAAARRQAIIAAQNERRTLLKLRAADRVKGSISRDTLRERSAEKLTSLQVEETSRNLYAADMRLIQQD